ncbi:putative nuclease HARBI1 [Merluccius polli]|uniref:Putative nuclease HARBI1 n=1 Tax=Merluccius polli TaxID=89951 RepID=A0AA47MRU7_MERPO|nr:putative nuclease HARBI1 [Merluccius polli]
MAYLALLEDLENRALRRERIFKERADLLSESRVASKQIPIPQKHTDGVMPGFTTDVGARDSTHQSHPSAHLAPVHPGIFGHRDISTRDWRHMRHFTADTKQNYAGRQHHQQPDIKQGFHAILGFPNIIGAIDCTHIIIKAPSHNEFSYVNRKGLHSINTHIICNANMSLLNVVGRWPGGTHDSFILQNSSVGVHLQAGAVEDGWLIGDRGYPLKPWLMTPVANPRTPQEQHYNRVHARSRSVVERAIGLLKGRWLCLSSAGGALQYKPEKVCHIILACCVLHNLAIRHGVPLQEPPRADEPIPNAEHFPLPNAAANQTRERIIQRL